MLFFAADLHLKPRIWEARKDITGDSYTAWHAMVAVICKYPGSALLLGGDVFHTASPSGEDQYHFAEGMQRLQEADVQVWGIPGNHDIEGYYRPRLHGLKMLSPEPVTLNGLSVAGIPWIRSSAKLVEVMSELPPCDILVTHCGFEHLLGFEGAVQCTDSDVPEHVGKIFNGHVHTKNITRRVYSPGSLSVNSVAEFNTPHGFFWLDEATGGVGHVSINTREFVTHLWDGPPKSLPGPKGKNLPVMNMIYTKDQTAEVDRFKEEHAEAILFLDNVQTIETLDTSPVAAGTGFDLGQVIQESIQHRLKDNPDAYQLATDLVSSDTPVEILESYLQEHTEEE